MTTATTPEAPDERITLLHAAYPCCQKRSRFPTEASRYLRRCPTCGKRWRVLRSTPSPSAFALRLGLRIDVLTWERRL
jgi:hypothetical protein